MSKAFRGYVVSRFWGVVLVVVAALVLLLAFGMQVRFLELMLGRISTETVDVHADFDTFWNSARAFREGGDLYHAGARLLNLNPPLWTLIVYPLSFLDTLEAYRVFIGLTVAVMVAYLSWMASELRLGGGWAVVATGMLLVSSPFLATLALGQIYAFLTLGLVAAWVFDRREKPVASGVALGLVIAVKPSLLPLLLWPLVRRRWGTVLAALVSGGVATLFAAVVAGFGTTFEWMRLLLDSPLNAYWDNASLPAAAARLFTDNEYARPLALLPGAVPAAYIVGISVVALTAWLARRDPSMGLWALVAASLIASPIAWHNYLMLLAPGILILISRGRPSIAFLLLALQTIPSQWPLLWRDDGTPLASLMLTLYLFILFLHWVALLPSDTSKHLAAERVPDPA